MRKEGQLSRIRWSTFRQADQDYYVVASGDSGIWLFELRDALALDALKILNNDVFHQRDDHGTVEAYLLPGTAENKYRFARLKSLSDRSALTIALLRSLAWLPAYRLQGCDAVLSTEQTVIDEIARQREEEIADAIQELAESDPSSTQPSCPVCRGELIHHTSLSDERFTCWSCAGPDAPQKSCPADYAATFDDAGALVFESGVAQNGVMIERSATAVFALVDCEWVPVPSEPNVPFSELLELAKLIRFFS